MLLVMKLTRRERDEFAQAILDHRARLLSSKIPGRHEAASSVYEKFCKAREEARRR